MGSYQGMESKACCGQAIRTPCAGCKFLRRKCQSDCIFAPYFPLDQPQKFMNVHRVFGASNISKILNQIDKSQRDDAVNSLAFEAEMQLREPIHGCLGLISLHQNRLRQIRSLLSQEKLKLAKLLSIQKQLEMALWQRQQQQAQRMMMM